MRGAILAGVIATISSVSQAGTFWIAPNGNNSTPCANIQGTSDPGQYRADANGAIACLNDQPGHTIMVKPGHYAVGDYWINNPPSGTTIISQVPRGAKVHGNPNGGSGAFVAVDGGRSYVTVRGFEAYDVAKGIDLCAFDCGGRTGPFSTNWTFEDNYIHHTYGTGFITTHDTTLQNHVFRGNEFSHIGIHFGPGYGPGMNILYNIGNGTLIENNIFHDSVHGVADCGGGAHPDSPGGCNGPYSETTGTVIRNNIFYNMGRCDLHPWMIGANGSNPIGVVAPGTAKYYNNLIYDSGCSQVPFIGIWTGVYGADGANEFYNNTLYNILSGVAIRNEPGYTGALLRNNVVYQAASQMELNGLPAGNVSNNLCGSPDEGCALVGNPLFVNAAAGNFNLQAGSPAIGTGANLYSQGVTTDLAGKPRPQSGAFDLGAYQAGGSAPPPPATTVTASAASVPPGASVTATVANGPGGPTDWVGVYLATAPSDSTNMLSWLYLNGSKTAPAAGLTAATLAFAMPAAAGTYQFRFFLNDGFTETARSADIAVGSSMPTDLNGDGRTDVSDVQLAVNQAMGGACSTGDVNGDGSCNIMDVQMIVNKALGG